MVRSLSFAAGSCGVVPPKQLRVYDGDESGPSVRCGWGRKILLVQALNSFRFGQSTDVFGRL